MLDLMGFQRGQQQMTAYLRDPEHVLPPADIEQRRLDIYKDLVYNNIEGFISGGFPVLRSLYSDVDWHAMVRSFVAEHQCESPYFLEISQEFLRFLPMLVSAQDHHPGFLLELAHYEWVELAIDVGEESQVIECAVVDDFLTTVPMVSSLAWSLAYQYPVHQIGPGFQPTAPLDQSTYLIVYRNRQEEVQFIESNSVTARLLEMLGENDGRNNLRQLLVQLSVEMSVPDQDQIVDFGGKLIEDFFKLGIIINCR